MRHRGERRGQPLTGERPGPATIVLWSPRPTPYPAGSMEATTALASPVRPRWLRATVTGVFSLQFVVLGLCLEGLRPYLGSPGLVLSALQSALLWGLLALPAESSRLWRGLVCLAAAPILVLQVLFHARYGTFIDAEVVRSTIRFWADVKPELSAFAPRIGLLTLGVAIAEFAWLSLSCRRAPGLP